METTPGGRWMACQLLLLISIPCLLQAQEVSLEGRITDRETGAGIALASVYINGSTRGTTSDEQGFFTLDRIRAPCELIISHIGYEVKSLPLNDPAGPRRKLSITLESKAVPLPGTTVSSHSIREECMKQFQRFFLGTSYEELEVEILNDSVLTFMNVRGPVFDVRASAPIQISMPQTGYRLSVDLLNFRLRYLSDSLTLHSSILGYFHFTPEEPEQGRKYKKMVRLRNKVYYGSRTHFLESLYRDQLLEEGFDLAAACWRSDTTGMAESAPFQKSYTEDKQGNPVLVLGDFSCRNYYLRYFYHSGKKPADLRRKPDQWVSFMSSPLRFTGDTVCIYPTGRVPDNSLLVGGPMGEKGISHILPLDFIPAMR